MNEEPDCGDHQEHDRSELIRVEADVDVEVAGRDPGEEMLSNRLRLVANIKEREDREQPRAKNRGYGDQVRLVLDVPAPQQEIDRERRQWQRRNQKQIVSHPPLALSRQFTSERIPH